MKLIYWRSPLQSALMTLQILQTSFRCLPIPFVTIPLCQFHWQHRLSVYPWSSISTFFSPARYLLLNLWWDRGRESNPPLNHLVQPSSPSSIPSPRCSLHSCNATVLLTDTHWPSLSLGPSNSSPNSATPRTPIGWQRLSPDAVSPTLRYVQSPTGWFKRVIW